MDQGKRNKQKKKKNKQGKKNESVPAGVGEPTSENTNHVNVTKQNHQNLNSETEDGQNKGLQHAGVSSDRQPINGAETSCSVEAEKSYWLNREASLEQKIKELQEQVDMHLHREADLERNMSHLQIERSVWHHKEAELEKRILQLQTEKDSWLQKEAGYEGKVNRLLEETSTLRSMGVSFNERFSQMEDEKVSLSQRENSAAETIASLNKENARLRAQVIELEASRNNVSHQNQLLKEQVSDLQSKVRDLESSMATRLSSERTMHVTENEEMKPQLESARALVEKLVSENQKLVEKVNSLNAELDQKSQSSLPIKPDDPILRNSKPDPIAEKPDTVSNMGTSSESKEEMVSDKVMDGIRLKKREGWDLNPSPSGEIVQIPLDVDERDVLIPTSTAAVIPDKVKEEVPLTDAPLIGAPFRLISFVARYVSGADLVEKRQIYI